MARTIFITALALAGAPHVGRIYTTYCRDDFGCVIPGCQGHHSAKVHKDHIDRARNACVKFNGNGSCTSASVYM